MIANGVDRTRFTPHGHRIPRSGWQVDLNPDGEVINRRPLPDLLATDPAWASYFHGAGETPRLVWVGKFTQMKGFDRLQQIAHRLAGRARLLIVLGHGQGVHYRGRPASRDTDLPGSRRRGRASRLPGR